MDSIRRIVHALEVSSRVTQQSVGLSGAQLFVLQVLSSGGAFSVNELAARTHTHQSSVSVVVSRLLEAKLIKRSRSPNDRRCLTISASAAGLRLLQSRIVTPQEALLASLEKFPPARLNQLRTLLEDVLAQSGLPTGVPPMFFEKPTRAASASKASTGRDAAPRNKRGTSADLGADRESVVPRNSLKKTPRPNKQTK